MCIGESDSAKFIRRRDAAINFLKKLLDEGKLSDKQAVVATSNKFDLCPSVRNDYRIFVVLCDLIGD